MVLLYLLLLICISFLSLVVYATDKLIITNGCSYDAWGWTVAPGYPGEDWDRIRIPGNGTTTILDMTTTTAGVSFKIRDLPRYRVAPAGVLQVEYNLHRKVKSLYYDFSVINCNLDAGPKDAMHCPLFHSGVDVYPKGNAEGHCLSSSCRGKDCERTYKDHGSWPNEPTLHCYGEPDIVVNLCRLILSHSLNSTGFTHTFREHDADFLKASEGILHTPSRIVVTCGKSIRLLDRLLFQRLHRHYRSCHKAH